MSSITNISLSLQAGYTYTLHIPTTLANDGGFFPRKGSVKMANGDLEPLRMGFCVENKEVGDIVATHADKVAVDYKHFLPAENTIWFYSATGERARIMTMPMTVHDHASIATGGPAYGTYFSYVDDNNKESK